jgi:hypothetical protein
MRLARANQLGGFSVGTNVGSAVAVFTHQPQHNIITFASPVTSHDIVKQTQKTYVTYDGPCYWNKIISTFDPLWKASLASYILDQLAATSFQQITTIKFDILPEGRSENKKRE